MLKWRKTNFYLHWNIFLMELLSVAEPKLFIFGSHSNNSSKLTIKVEMTFSSSSYLLNWLQQIFIKNIISAPPAPALQH